MTGIHRDLRVLILFACGLLALSGPLRADQPARATTVPAEQISQWIDMLDARTYAQRRQARARLIQAGTDAIPLLRKAMGSGQAELSDRAGEIFQVIRAKLPELGEPLRKRIVWTRPETEPSWLQLSGGVLLAENGGLMGLDARTGKTLWHAQDVGWLSEWCCDGRRVYFPGKASTWLGGREDGTVGVRSASYLVAVDVKTGKPVKGFKPSPAVGRPAVADGKVFVYTKQVLSAIDAETGKLLGHVKMPLILHPPRVTETHIVVTDRHGQLTAIDRRKIAVAWRETITETILEDVRAVGDLVLVKTLDRLEARELATGKVVWKLEMPDSPSVGRLVTEVREDQKNDRARAQATDKPYLRQVIYLPRGMAIRDHCAYFSQGKQLWAVQVRSGRKLWTYPIDSPDRPEGAWGELSGSVTIGGRRTYAGDGGPPLSPVCMDDGWLYVGSRQGLHAVDLAGPMERWIFTTDSPVACAPLARGEWVYFSRRCQSPSPDPDETDPEFREMLGQPPKEVKAALFALKLTGKLPTTQPTTHPAGQGSVPRPSSTEPTGP